MKPLAVSADGSSVQWRPGAVPYGAADPFDEENEILLSPSVLAELMTLTLPDAERQDSAGDFDELVAEFTRRQAARLRSVGHPAAAQAAAEIAEI